MADKKLKVDLTETAKQLEDIELEKSIVGYVMNHVSYVQIQELRRRIKTKYFWHEVTRHVWQIILYLNEQGKDVTPMLVQPEVMRRGKIEIGEFLDLLNYSNKLLSYVDVLEHVEVLIDYAKRRELWLIGQRMIKEGTTVGAEFGKVAEGIKKDIDEVLYDAEIGKGVSMCELLNEIQTKVEENKMGRNADMCINTGFDFIDKQDGLSKGDLDIIAASSSVGKTAFAVSLTINVIEQGYDVAFFSTEMMPIQISARILSHYSGLYSSVILKKPLTEEQKDRYDTGVTKVYEASKHLFFHEKNTSDINEIMQSIRKLHSEFNIKGVIIDFIQRLSGRERGETDNEFYARVSKKLKDLALELNIWIVILSQLNRANDNSRESKDDTKYIPSLDRLRGSGEIAEAADNVWFIYRPEYYNKEYGKNIRYPAPYTDVRTEGTAMIIVGKGRNVGTGSFIVGFDAGTTHFYNMPEPPKVGVDLRKDEGGTRKDEGKAKGVMESKVGGELPF